MKFKIEFDVKDKNDADWLCFLLAKWEEVALEHGGCGAGVAHQVLDLRHQLRIAMLDLPGELISAADLKKPCATATKKARAKPS